MNIISSEKSNQPNGGAEPLGQLTGKNTQAESSPDRSGNSKRLEPTALAIAQNHQPVTEDQTREEKTHGYGYGFLQEDVAAEIRSKLQADWWDWLCDVVSSNLPLKEKRQRIEYALQISDPLLECQFEKIFGQHTSWEVKHFKLTEKNGFGFRRINWDLLKIGLKLKDNGHLTNDEKDFLRGDTSSGRWRMQAYVEQFIALIAWEINRPDKIPGRFRKWCPPRTPDEQFPMYEDVLKELESEEDQYDDHRYDDQLKRFKLGRKW